MIDFDLMNYKNAYESKISGIRYNIVYAHLIKTLLTGEALYYVAPFLVILLTLESVKT